ncbi:MAG: histidine phosphatase family protein [Gammaproteobacteria bacterium]
MTRARRFLLALVGLLPCSLPAKDTDVLWQALAAGNHIAIMRHAIAPGTGDPENFKLGDCATQRNLSAEGRAQARRIGEAFREHEVAVSAVLASEWCRCQDTAREMNLGVVKPVSFLNSFFGEREFAEERTSALRQFITDWRGGDSLVIVTHQVNIKALIGEPTDSGEIIVLEPGANGHFDVLGSINGEQ